MSNHAKKRTKRLFDRAFQPFVPGCCRSVPPPIAVQTAASARQRPVFDRFRTVWISKRATDTRGWCTRSRRDPGSGIRDPGGLRGAAGRTARSCGAHPDVTTDRTSDVPGSVVRDPWWRDPWCGIRGAGIRSSDPNYGDAGAIEFARPTYRAFRSTCSSRFPDPASHTPDPGSRLTWPQSRDRSVTPSR
jgi:hypothetical protein